MNPNIWVDYEGRNITVMGCDLVVPLTVRFLRSSEIRFELHEDSSHGGTATFSFQGMGNKDVERTYHSLVLHLKEKEGYEVNDMIAELAPMFQCVEHESRYACH